MAIHHCLRRCCILAAFLVLIGGAARIASAVPPESTATTHGAAVPARGTEALLRGGPHPWLAHANLSDVRDSLRAFYDRRGNGPCWVDRGRPTVGARAWVEALGRLAAYGVSSDVCDATQLAEALDAADAHPLRSEDESGDLDVAVTASIARALKALHSGRLDPAMVDSNLILLHRPLATSLTLDSIASGGDPQVWLEGVQPSFRQYWMLLQALARYRDLASDTALVLPDRAPKLRTDRPSGDVARLKLTLERAGDLRWGTVQGGPKDSLSDSRLVAAIGRFQRRHHLSPSGRLDGATWDSLRNAIPERVEQMGGVLEQYRWLPHELSAPLLFINIPAFKLEAMTRFDQPDSEILHIDVVVGTAFKTQTPVLTAALTSLDFMPTWDVPPSIATKEVQADALKDSMYLARNHMDLIRDMRVLPPTRANIERIGHGVRVRQQCGPDNPLGRVKFVMPNFYDIYLHDSPARALFGARSRDFSHGCIRLKDPVALARFALRDRPDWTAARIDSAMNGTETLKARLPIPMLVAIVYATAEAREDGRVVFYPDVYGHDRTLQLLLGGASQDTVRANRSRAMTRRHPAPPPPPLPPGVHPPMLPSATMPKAPEAAPAPGTRTP